MHPLSFLIMVLMVSGSTSVTISKCGTTYRHPEYTDISVTCGTTSMDLAILICPAVFTGYNESQLILNNIFDPTCKGTLDESVTPPVLRFKFPLNMTNACGSNFRTTSAAGSGIFADFSNIQTVNVSGMVRSNDPTTGTVTYNTELKYYYSCAYPLEYLINNTRADVSGSSIAVKDNNGSFIGTLSMKLFSDVTYSAPMVIPPLGIELRTNIYVQVQATNLTAQYFVLLDRCYASIFPHPTTSTFFNLFVACSKDQMTTMLENGQSQNARFSFPAFRFIEQQNQTKSTYYIHCVTRLCERSTCNNFLCGNTTARRRRDTDSAATATEGLTESSTLSLSRPIVTRAESVLTSREEGLVEESQSPSTVGLGVAVGVLFLTVFIVVGMAAVVYLKRTQK